MEQGLLRITTYSPVLKHYCAKLHSFCKHCPGKFGGLTILVELTISEILLRKSLYYTSSLGTEVEKKVSTAEISHGMV